MLAIGSNWTVSDTHNVVAPRCASDGLALLSVHLERSAEECVYADIVLGCHCNNVRIAERKSSNLFSLGQLSPPVCAGSPRLMWPIEDGCWTTVRGAVGKQCTIVICARLVKLNGTG